MRTAKKASGSYLIILLVVSGLIGTLLFFILDATISNSDVLCDDVSLYVSASCKSSQGMELVVNNEGSRLFIFELNDVLDEKYYVNVNDSKTIIYDEETSSLKFMPFVIDENKRKHVCIEKAEYVSLEGLGKC